MNIIAATSNKHKLREIRQILKGFRVLGLGPRVKENGRTFEENAVKKAKTAFKKSGLLSIADDSGLMVDCLGGKPGIRSARFANPPTPENLCTKLLKVMSNEKCATRKAKFVCAIAIVSQTGKIRVVKGIVHGKIALQMRGKDGFGYDPVFIPQGFKKTFAEMSPAQKNKLSHRFKALIKARKVLSKI